MTFDAPALGEVIETHRSARSRSDVQPDEARSEGSGLNGYTSRSRLFMRPRPRLTRLLTVPIGSPVISAISAVESRYYRPIRRAKKAYAERIVNRVSVLRSTWPVKRGRSTGVSEMRQCSGFSRHTGHVRGTDHFASGNCSIAASFSLAETHAKPLRFMPD